MLQVVAGKVYWFSQCLFLEEHDSIFGRQGVYGLNARVEPPELIKTEDESLRRTSRRTARTLEKKTLYLAPDSVTSVVAEPGLVVSFHEVKVKDF